MGLKPQFQRTGPSSGSPLQPKLNRELVDTFRVTLDLPPSTNKLYQKRRGGGLALTDAARSFQESVKRHIRDFLPELTRFPVDQETVYQCSIILFFDKLENPGWFETYSKGKDIGKRKAQTRYKIIDYDNRIKFLQDCLVKAIGIPNDCQIFRGVQEKREDPQHPRAEVEIQVRRREEFFPERRTDASTT